MTRRPELTRRTLLLPAEIACFWLMVLSMITTQAVAQDSDTSAPTTSQQRLPTHAELVATASDRPLVIPEYRRPDGKPVSEAELSELRDAERRVNTAIELRRSGEYQRARAELKPAIQTYQKLLSPTQHLFVTAVSTAASLDKRASAGPDELAQFKESDRQEKLALDAVRNGRFVEARAAARACLEIREKLLGKEHPELVEPLRILGNALTELRALDEAGVTLLRALDMSERIYGKAHPQTALVLDRIGWLQIYQSKNEDAATALRRALFILNAAVGENADTAETMDNLGTALGTSRNDFIEAVNHKLRALVIREKLLGADSKEAGISLSNLAWLYARSGLRDEVIPLRRRALDIFEKQLGPTHRDTMVEKSNLAQSYRSVGQLDEALKLYRSMSEADDQADTATDPGAVNRLMMVGMLELETGRQLEGEKTLERAFNKAVRLYEAGEQSAAMNELDQLALAYQSRRMLEDAVRVREKLQEYDDARSGRRNEIAIRRSTHLGRLYVEVGRAKDGVRLLTKTVEQARGLYGETERELTGPLLALAHAQLEADELSDASRTCTEVLRITEDKFPRRSLNAAYALHAMGKVQIAQKNYDIAQFSLEEAREIVERNRIDDPVKYIALMRDLSVCYLENNEPQKAVQVMREALAMCDKIVSSYPMQLKTMKTNTLKYLVDALARDSSADRAERESLTAELKKNVTELRDTRALTAEMKDWLKEWGMPTSRG